MKKWNEMNDYEQREVCLTCPYYFGELDECMIEEVHPTAVLDLVSDKACYNYKQPDTPHYPKLYRVTAVLNDVEFVPGEEWVEDILADTPDEAEAEMELKLSERRISIDYISVELLF